MPFPAYCHVIAIQNSEGRVYLVPSEHMFMYDVTDALGRGSGLEDLMTLASALTGGGIAPAEWDGRAVPNLATEEEWEDFQVVADHRVDGRITLLRLKMRPSYTGVLPGAASVPAGSLPRGSAGGGGAGGAWLVVRPVGPRLTPHISFISLPPFDSGQVQWGDTDETHHSRPAPTTGNPNHGGSPRSRPAELPAHSRRGATHY